MKRLNTQHLESKYLNVFIVCLILFLPFTTVYAAVDFNTMMSAMKDNLRPVIYLTCAFAYVLGTWFVISGLQELKSIGQSHMQAQGGALGGPLMKVVIGILLVYLPSTINIMLVSLWQSSSVIAYNANTGDPFSPTKEGVVMLVRTLGYVSFVRGFMILSRVSYQGSQPGTASKGILHIVGGIFAINVVATVRVIGNSLGITGIL